MHELKPFFFTFVQKHPLRDYWIEIHAPDDELARFEMVDLFGRKWAFQYDDADFKPEYYPKGRLGDVIEVL